MLKAEQKTPVVIKAVRDAMDSQFLTVHSSDLLQKAYNLMTGSKQPYAIVLEAGSNAVAGFLTMGLLKDYLPPEKASDLRKYSQGIEDSLSKTRINEVMIPFVALVTLKPDDEIASALRAFLTVHSSQEQRYRVRSMPVVNAAYEAEGVLGYWHLIDSLRNLIGSEQVGQVMWPLNDLYVAHEDDSLEKVFREIRLRAVNDVVILDSEQKLAGMISADTVFNRIHHDFRELFDTPIHQFMRPIKLLRRLTGDEPLREVIPHLSLDSAAIGAMPVVDRNERFIGLLSYVIVLDILLQHLTTEPPTAT